MKDHLKNLAQLLVPANYLVYHGSRRRREVALTFDDGPNPAYTLRTLDLLKDFNIKASFFLVGSVIARNETVAQRIKDEGHHLCNHTYSHWSGKRFSAVEWMDEIEKTKVALSKLGCSGLIPLRPPHGTLPLPFLYAAMRTSSKIVLWSIDSRDWEKEASDKILKAVFKRPLLNGDIILMHDDNESTLSALPGLISRAAGEGFSFVTLEQMMGAVR